MTSARTERLRNEEQDQADQRVEGEDVAEPDEVEMDEAEQEQPEHAPVMDRGRRVARRRGALDHQQGARAEQEGEEAAHLAVDEDEAERPRRRDRRRFRGRRRSGSYRPGTAWRRRRCSSPICPSRRRRGRCRAWRCGRWALRVRRQCSFGIPLARSFRNPRYPKPAPLPTRMRGAAAGRARRPRRARLGTAPWPNPRSPRKSSPSTASAPRNMSASSTPWAARPTSPSSASSRSCGRSIAPTNRRAST